MSMTDKQELQKTIDIAKEFIQRAEVMKVELGDDDNRWRYPSINASALRRQSMELTRQLAILRRA